MLNHSDTEHTCERCRTVFKSPDLLGKHIDHGVWQGHLGSWLDTVLQLDVLLHHLGQMILHGDSSWRGRIVTWLIGV